MSIELEVKNIQKRFGDTYALRGLEFRVERGELFFLLGPSGCGKTTALRVIAGLEKPDAGKILFDGEDITWLPPEKRGVGMVFQNYALWPHMTVFENVAYGLVLKGIRGPQLEERVGEMLELLGVAKLAQRYPHELSGGEQQRVALARALITKPRLLLLDEPLSNLDAPLRAQLRAEIRKIQKLQNLTAIYVTHDQEEALTLADRVAVMRDGKVVQIDTPENLYKRPRDAFVAKFVGASNIISGRVRELEHGFAVINSSCGRLRINSGGRKLREGEKVLLCIRPEIIKVNQGGSVKGEVEDKLFSGDRVRMHVRVGETLLNISLTPDEVEGVKVGDKVSLSIDEEEVVLLEDEKEAH